MSGSTKIYISRRGQRYGPYSREELDLQLDASNFDFEDFASTDGGRSWLAIRSLPGLKAFALQADEPRNLLIIRYRGRVTPADVAHCASEVDSALSTLQPGFGLLVDLSRLESMDPLCAEPIQKIMQLCNDAQVAVVARVVPDRGRDIGFQIMSSFHYGKQVRVVTCASLEEAEQALVESPSPSPN